MEIALLRSELAKKPSFEEMHQYADSIFLDLNSKLESIKERNVQTVQNTYENWKIVRQEALCLQKIQHENEYCCEKFATNWPFRGHQQS